MTMTMSVDLTCPNCKSKCRANVLASTNFLGGMTTDLRRMTIGGDPLQFMVHSCQQCGFTGNEEDFKRKVGKDVSEKIRQQIKPHLGDGRLSADTRWEFAGMIAEWRKRPALAIAERYRNAAWCANGGERESCLRRRAADWFERALETKVPDRSVILYLIGEMYRRCGEKSVADGWFDAAIREAKGCDADRIKQLAEQQKTNPKDLIS